MQIPHRQIESKQKYLHFIKGILVIYFWKRIYARNYLHFRSIFALTAFKSNLKQILHLLVLQLLQHNKFVLKVIRMIVIINQY